MRDRARHATLIGVGTIAQVVLDGRAGVSGSPVDTWTGRPGTSVNATGSGAARPTTTTLNGQPALLFDGVDDQMTMSAGALSVFQNVGNGHVLAVCNDTNNTGGMASHDVFYWSTPGGVTRIRNFTRNASVSGLLAVARRLDADGAAFSGPLTPGGGALIAETQCNWSGNSMTVLRSGVAATSTTFPSGGGSTSNTASTAATIGNDAGGTFNFPGPIAAVIATNQAWSTSLASLVRLCLSRSFLIPLEA